MPKVIKKGFQLTNYEGQNPLDIVFGDSNPGSDQFYFTDLDLDGNGNIRLISGKEQILQSALKCVFTEKQDNGYGTNIYDLIGEKDVVVRRGSLLMDITMSMLALKSFNDAQALPQNLNSEDLLATISRMVVSEDPNDPTQSKVSLTLQTTDGANLELGVL